MTKFIFYTDIHHGIVMKAARSNSVNILGPFAISMQRALNAYAEKQGIDTLLHGGDEATFIKKQKYPMEHLDATKEMFSVMNEFSGDVIRTIGNHEPTDYINDLSFSPSTLIKGVSNSSLNIALCQPSIDLVGKKIIYSYNQNKLCSIFNNNILKMPLITMGHFAFDRPTQGFPEIHPPNSGYAYKESATFIRTILQTIESANQGAVISLHGHEHRFRLTTSEGFRCLTMPSIVQEDRLKEDEPCGLFAEIDLNDTTNALSITFKKIILNTENPEQSEVRKMSQKYMQNYYYRPFIPKAA